MKKLMFFLCIFTANQLAGNQNAEVIDSQKTKFISMLLEGKSIDDILHLLEIDPADSHLAQDFLHKVLPPLIQDLQTCEIVKNIQSMGTKIAYNPIEMAPSNVSSDLERISNVETIQQALLIWYIYNYKQYYETRVVLSEQLKKIYDSLPQEQQDLLRKLAI